MLCRLAVCRLVHQRSDRTDYVLRVAASPTLGSAGNLGSDERTFSAVDEMARCLRFLGVSEATITSSEAAVKQPTSALRFVTFADAEQVPFDRLQDADFDIFSD